MFGEDSLPDIDVYEIGSSLGKGFMRSVLCEGCEMIGVFKDLNGVTHLLYDDEGLDGPEVKKIPIKEWEGKSIFDSGIKEDVEIQPFIKLRTDNGSIAVKIIEGMSEPVRMFHVIKEILATGRTEYTYLSEQEIVNKFGLDPKGLLIKVQIKTNR